MNQYNSEFVEIESGLTLTHLKLPQIKKLTAEIRMKRQVVVIGGGVIGAICALEAQKVGMQVTLLEPGIIDGEQSASYGNAGWLSSHSVLPPFESNIWRKIPNFVLDPLGPLAIRWKYLHKAIPWLARYVANNRSNMLILERARVLRSLLIDSPLLHQNIAKQVGAAHLIRQGVLHVFASRADFYRDAPAWEIRRQVGVKWRELGGDELHQVAPGLHARYQFGVIVDESGYCIDPSAYVKAIVEYACKLGVKVTAASACGFRIDAGRLRAVITGDSEIACDYAVIAAGARSKALAAHAGDRVPLETERGYHAQLYNPGQETGVPVMLTDYKVIVSPMQAGLKIAGQVEFAGLAALPNWRRAEALRKILKNTWNDLPDSIDSGHVKFWMGHRPSLPDCLPCIGYASASQNIVHAFGHAHIGLSASARTGLIVAKLLAGRDPELEIGPFNPRRFRNFLMNDRIIF